MTRHDKMAAGIKMAESWRSLPLSRSATALILCLLTALSCCGTVNGRARFLSHIPYDEQQELPDAYDEDNENIHDSIVKLPGRHYPKLPYSIPVQNTDLSNHRFDPYMSQRSQDGRLRSQGVASDTQPSLSAADPRIEPLRVNQQQVLVNKKLKAKSTASTRHGTFTHGQPYHNDNTDMFGDSRGYVGGFNDPTGIRTDGSSSGQASLRQNDEEHDLMREDTQHGVAEEAHSEAVPGPRFDRSMVREVTVQAGETAQLSCRVYDLGQQSVSWIRLKDLSILTVSGFRFSTDRRVSVEHVAARHEWLLEIARVSHSDSGEYECQLSTKPVLSFIVNLVVADEPVAERPLSGEVGLQFPEMESPAPEQIEPEAQFLLGPDIFLQAGSLLTLTCVVSHQENRPVFVNWFHQDKAIRSNVTAADPSLFEGFNNPSVNHENSDMIVNNNIDDYDGPPEQHESVDTTDTGQQEIVGNKQTSEQNFDTSSIAGNKGNRDSNRSRRSWQQQPTVCDPSIGNEDCIEHLNNPFESQHPIEEDISGISNQSPLAQHQRQSVTAAVASVRVERKSIDKIGTDLSTEEYFGLAKSMEHQVTRNIKDRIEVASSHHPNYDQHHRKRRFVSFDSSSRRIIYQTSEQLQQRHHHSYRHKRFAGNKATSEEMSIFTRDHNVERGRARKSLFFLVVGQATSDRAGAYTCQPLGGRGATVTVHSVQGIGSVESKDLNSEASGMVEQPSILPSALLLAVIWLLLCLLLFCLFCAYFIYVMCVVFCKPNRGEGSAAYPTKYFYSRTPASSTGRGMGSSIQ